MCKYQINAKDNIILISVTMLYLLYSKQGYSVVFYTERCSTIQGIRD